MMSTRLAIDTNADVIDSRDIRDRINYLGPDIDPGDVDDLAEYEMLSEFWEENSDEEWDHGVTLVNERYTAEYAEQFADDIGVTQSSDTWPFGHIDWERAADELFQDAAEVMLDGITFYVR